MKDKKNEPEVVEKSSEDVAEQHHERDTEKKKVKKVKKKEKSEENEQLKAAQDKNLRLSAEYANYRKRTAKEIYAATSKGKIEVIKELLEVIDNFERALKVATKDQEYSDGIALIYKSLQKKLLDLGLEEVDCSKRLDPQQHHAVATDNLEEYDDDQIIEVMQKGYILDEQLIRPAMVKVNKK